MANRLNANQKKVLPNHLLPLSDAPYFAQEQEINDLIVPLKEGGNFVKDHRGQRQYYLKEESLANLSKKGLYYNEPIKLIISTFHLLVFKVVEKSLPYFFAYENFGTRQSKGFGCFSVIDPPPPEDYVSMLKKVFRIGYQHRFIRGGAELYQVFPTILDDYRLLKSGLNFPNRPEDYRKSLLFLYGLSLDPPIRWDKRFIKTRIFANRMKDRKRVTVNLKTSDNRRSSNYDDQGNQSWTDPESFEYAYLRAMLGLAEQYEFQTDQGFNIKYVVDVNVVEGIDRFASPLKFKFSDSGLFLMAEPIDEQIQQARFHFILKLKEGKRITKGPSLSINGPLKAPENFSLKGFLEFALEKYKGKERIRSWQNLF